MQKCSDNREAVIGFCAKRAYGESYSVSPLILKVNTKRRYVISFTTRPFDLHIKRTRNPLNRRLDGPQSRSGPFGKEKLFCPCRDTNLDFCLVQPVAQSVYCVIQAPVYCYLIYSDQWCVRGLILSFCKVGTLAMDSPTILAYRHTQTI